MLLQMLEMDEMCCTHTEQNRREATESLMKSLAVLGFVVVTAAYLWLYTYRSSSCYFFFFLSTKVISYLTFSKRILQLLRVRKMKIFYQVSLHNLELDGLMVFDYNLSLFIILLHSVCMIWCESINNSLIIFYLWR